MWGKGSEKEGLREGKGTGKGPSLSQFPSLVLASAGLPKSADI